MELNEFEEQIRHSLDAVLNQLQTATLLSVQLNNQLAGARDSVQDLTELIDRFFIEEKEQRNE